METISFQEAINAFNNQNYQLVANYVEQGNPPLEFNGDQLIEVELIYLVTSAKSLNDQIIKLIKQGVNLDDQTSDDDQYTAVHFAAWDNKSDILEFLLQNGANPNVIGGDGLSALYLACVNGNYDSVKCLVDHGAELNHLYNGIGIDGLSDYFSKNGGTVLRGALINIELEITQYLIDHGADVMELNNPCKGYILDVNNIPTNNFLNLVNHNYLNNPQLQSSKSKENLSEILMVIKRMLDNY